MSTNGAGESLNLSILAIIVGFLFSIAISLIFIFITAFILHFTGVSEGSLNVAGYLIVFLSVFAGSIVAAKRAAVKGLIHGIGVAVFYLIFSLLFSSMAFDSDISALNSISKVLVILFAGSIGGFLGIGLVKSK
ncbi:putative membrane protein (TIGR04086 family) [Desulfitispora alkaliphila]|uniref:TIGR04086 family membrane protein n=1 Tax=Desulfitispora alkaliphila TaxID=622674 RepID=UPI003D214B96